MNESTTRIDNTGLYASRWLVLLENLGFPRTAPVENVMLGLGIKAGAEIAALRDAASAAYNYIALMSVVVDEIRRSFDMQPTGTTADNVLEQIAAALATVRAAPRPAGELRAELLAAFAAARKQTALPPSAADAPLASSRPDRLGRTWHLLQRQNRTVSLYYTCDDKPAHYVVYDSLDQPSDDSLRAEVAHLREEVASWERVNGDVVRERNTAEERVAKLEADMIRLLATLTRTTNVLQEIIRHTEYGENGTVAHHLATAALTPRESDAEPGILEFLAEESDRERSQAHSWRQLCDEIGIAYATHPAYLVKEGALAENKRLRGCIQKAIDEIESAPVARHVVATLSRVEKTLDLALQGGAA